MKIGSRAAGVRACLQGLAIAGVLLAGACAHKAPAPPSAAGAPKYPSYPTPDVPATLTASPEVRARQAEAWQRLQSGDLKGASREFNDILKKSPDFYPAQTGLGFASLADRQFRQAATRFGAAIVMDDRYLPAWIGQSEAQIGLGNDADAITAMERVLQLDPGRTDVQSRLALLRFRQVQTQIETARKAKNAGRLDDAQRGFETALRLSPGSSAILKELAALESSRGELDQAEAHARQATTADPNDAEAQALLGSVLEARQDYRAASAAYSKAAAIDPRPEWRTRARSLADKADLAAIPPEYRDLAASTTLTRGQVAAFLALRLPSLIDRAPQRPPAVITDIRTHWAAPWIVPVTRAGVMDVYANHAFQPNATVTRAALAQILSRLVAELPPARQSDVARWRAARPRFPDLPAGNVNYRAAALAVASGLLPPDADGGFAPTRPATGAELDAAIARLQAFAAR